MIFRNGKVPERAIGWLRTPSQVQLWDYLDEQCIEGRPGCDALVIPHNSNLSGGLMFETARVTNDSVPTEPVTAQEAARRARWNTLFEVVQHKGSSECDSRLPVWSEDEFCAFEKMGYDRFGGKNTGQTPFADMAGYARMIGLEAPETIPPPASNFLRYGLKKGLRQQAELGANSFKFGLIGSTDTHIATPGLVMEKRSSGARRRRHGRPGWRPAGTARRTRIQPGRSGGALRRGKFPRRAVRRDASARGLRHQRHAPDIALLRRLGLRLRLFANHRIW